jgi:RNA polymerase sigma-70 factor (ECF subfamily)
MLETSKDKEHSVSSTRPSLVGLFKSEEAPLLRFAYGIVKRRNIAEEIVQEGFLRLHKHWEEVEKPRPWIYRAVRNLALSHLRDTKREFESEDGVADRKDDSAGPDASAHQMEAIGMVRMLVEELDSRDRDLVRRKYVDDQSYKEIAEATGLTVGNVGYRLHHALKSLASSLRQVGIEGSEG